MKVYKILGNKMVLGKEQVNTTSNATNKQTHVTKLGTIIELIALLYILCHHAYALLVRMCGKINSLPLCPNAVNCITQSTHLQSKLLQSFS